jgi:hypothetical protein
VLGGSLRIDDVFAVRDQGEVRVACPVAVAVDQAALGEAGEQAAPRRARPAEWSNWFQLIGAGCSTRSQARGDEVEPAGVEPDPQLMVNDRADCCAWRLALEALSEALSGKLARIAALPPAAALFPWTGEKDGDRPRGLFSLGAERVNSAGEAATLAGTRARSERRPLLPGRASARARRPAKPAKAMKG